MAQQKIFITGATGFIGRVVTEFAIRDGYNVRGLSRNEKGDALLTSLGATPVRGDLTSLDMLSQESAAADIIFHLAFDHDFSKPYEQILALDTAAVNALALPLAGTDKPLITTGGTAMVAPDPSGGETDESSPLPENPMIPRHLAEANALSWAQKGVRSIALRLPQYVYGRGTTTGFTALLIKLAVQSGESVYLGDGEYCASNVYVDDAARLYFAAAAKAKAGEIFNGTANTDTTYKAMATAIGEAAQVPVKSMTAEEAAGRWGPFLAAFYGLVNRASNKKAVEQLGWEPVGPSLLSEIQSGSYLAVVEEFKKAQAAGKL
ncbi:NAD(P)-binding protein [Aspergillus steynii IBT 23096]|uniref:NAD(P)-binding protein n=1 Tax=Aspergillus steynii IBT 23096 TaxID=1392250 RepID=A0A2I2G4C9_9EURO|nr:NAD(P)-binding protein [Aspergillus steynii IBT 23096]PLB47728.1 NAD(P)-binding protein [Aspergillus steynii IBT 23096]